jgi:hypothetical protein
MRDKWQRYALAIRAGGVVIILALLGFVGYQLYDFYEDKVGFTPSKAIETYFNALAQGNYEEVYRLTAQEHLTDIYGRPITKGEFISQLERVTGKRQLPFTRFEISQAYERGSSRYYIVLIHSNVGGAPGVSRVLVEVRRQGGGWVITYPFAIVL